MTIDADKIDWGFDGDPKHGLYRDGLDVGTLPREINLWNPKTDNEITVVEVSHDSTDGERWVTYEHSTGIALTISETVPY